MGQVDKTFVFSVLAMVVSVLALFVSFYEARILRSQQDMQKTEQAASVWPYLELKANLQKTLDKVQVTYYLINKGVGPALVKNTRIYIDEEEVVDYGVTFTKIKDGVSLENMRNLSLNMQFSGVLSPGEEVQLYDLLLGPEATNGFDFVPKFKICYCSIYKQCWSIDTTEDDKPQDPIQLDGPCDE